MTSPTSSTVSTRCAAVAAEFSPESVEATCRVPAETIRRITREYAAAPSAALYGRIGTCNQEFGTLTSWLVDVVNILTGNFDRPGGIMFGKPIAWGVNSLPLPDFADGVELGRWKSRVRGIPEVLGQVPVSCMAEEIDTPGPGQIRALVTIAGNPVISAPGAERLDVALADLECMISLDNSLNETTRHAHVLLPGLSALEQPHFDDLIPMWQVRSAARFTDAIFDVGDRPHEWEILTRLGAMCAGIRDTDIDVDGFDDGYFAALADAKGVDAAVAMDGSPGRGPLRLLDLQIRTGPWGDRYGEVPDGLSLAIVPRRGPRHRPGPDGAAGSGDPRHPERPDRHRAVGDPRRRPATRGSRRRAPPTASCSRPGATCARTTRGCTTSRF